MNELSASTPRPPGLTGLAAFNLVNFAAACVYFVVLFSRGFHEEPGWINTILAAVSGLLALISAIGFLRRNEVLGYWLGNAFGVFLLVYAVGFLAGKGSINPMEYFAWLSYPVILLFALNVLYRKEFAGPPAGL